MSEQKQLNNNKWLFFRDTSTIQMSSNVSFLYRVHCHIKTLRDLLKFQSYPNFYLQHFLPTTTHGIFRFFTNTVCDTKALQDFVLPNEIQISSFSANTTSSSSTFPLPSNIWEKNVKDDQNFNRMCVHKIHG